MYTCTRGLMTHAGEPAAAHHRVSHPYLMGSLVCPWRQGGLWCNKWSGWAEAVNEIISRMNEWHCEPMMLPHRAHYLDSECPPSQDRVVLKINKHRFHYYLACGTVCVCVCVCARFVCLELNWIGSKQLMERCVGWHFTALLTKGEGCPSETALLPASLKSSAAWNIFTCRSALLIRDMKTG